MAIDIGTGTTVTFGTSSFSANITNVGWSGIERPAIDTTHLGTTTARTFMPGDLFDPGELSLDIQFNPDNYPPITGAAETITVRFPIPAGLSNGATWVASGFMTSFELGNPLEELMTATMGVKFTGNITPTDAS